MKKALFAVLVLALSGLAFLPGPAAAQRAAPTQGWESLGPPGGDVADIVASPADPSRLYALVWPFPGQLFTSSDGGQSWTKRADLPAGAFHLATDPSNPAVLYALGRSVMKSIDSGATWTLTELGSGVDCVVGDIAVHPLDPNLVMATCLSSTEEATIMWWHYYFFRSTDAGQTWSQVRVCDLGRAGGGDPRLAVNPSNVNEAYIGGFAHGDDPSYTEGIIFKTVDGGATWTDVPGPYDPFGVEAVIVDPVHPATILVGTPWCVCRSTDGGLNWSLNQGQAFAREIAFDPVNSGTIYAGWDQVVFVSQDGGVNWTPHDAGLSGSCRCLLASGGSFFYGSAAGIFKSGDAGLTWHASQAGLNVSEILSFASAPSAPGIVYAAVGSSVFRSEDFGKTWAEPYVFGLGTLKQIVASPSDPDVVYALVQGCGSG